MLYRITVHYRLGDDGLASSSATDTAGFTVEAENEAQARLSAIDACCAANPVGCSHVTIGWVREITIENAS